MCWTEFANVYCATETCNSIIFYNDPVQQVVCEYALQNNKGFGWCGHKGRKQVAPFRAPKRSHICDGCREEAVKQQNELYANIEQRLLQSREDERRRDSQRTQARARARAEEEGLEGDRSAIRPEEQAALVYGTRTEWSSGQGDYSQGAPGFHADPGMHIDALPQELDLDADEPTNRDWTGPGEGSSSAYYDERYFYGGDQGHSQ